MGAVVDKFADTRAVGARIGPRNNNWRGGTTRSAEGYVYLRMPDHPRARNGYVAEHVVVAERALGHALPPTADVHHVNEHRDDNRPGNLVICENRGYHRLIHERLRAYRATGNADARRCRYCHAWAMLGDPDVAQHGRGHGYRRLLHLSCARIYDKERYAKWAS